MMNISEYNNLHNIEQVLSETHVKLIAYARQAHLELKHNVARLFEALSHSKEIQAIIILNYSGCIRDTKTNVEECLCETSLHNTRIENLSNEEKAFIENFNEIEEKSRHLYTCAVDSLEAGKDVSIGQINVCSKCGYLLLGDPPEKCVICHAPSGYFRAH